jgi:hypothetical protein
MTMFTSNTEAGEETCITHFHILGATPCPSGSLVRANIVL